MATPASSTTLQIPTAWLNVKPEFLQDYSQAMSSGQSDAAAYVSTHKFDESWLVPMNAINKLPYPPAAGGDEEKKELAYLHVLEKERTPALNETSQWLAKYGMVDVWEYYLAKYAQKAGPAQAAAAAKLLHDTLDMVNQATQISKSSNLRSRPFVVDPTLTLTVKRPGNNPSYPSGHTSEAAAGAIVMAYLMPELAKEILNIAVQGGYARMYAGVHFPTDVLNGARLGSMIATYMIEKARSQGQVLPLAQPAPATQPAQPASQPVAA